MATVKKAGLPGGFTVGTFPLYPEQVKRLVESHKKLKEHPLYLAVWYDLDDPKDIRLLEAVGNFPPYDEQGELFTTEFESTREFLIAAGGRLILTLADPEELRRAISERYPLVRRVQEAFARGAAKSLYCAPAVRDILRKLQSETE